MFPLHFGPRWSAPRDLGRYRHLFWDSLNSHSHNVMPPYRVMLAQFYCFGTKQNWWQLSREEHDDAVAALHAAREAFLSQLGGVGLDQLSEHYLRSRLGDADLGYQIHMMTAPQVEQAFRKAIEDGHLIFRPEPRAWRACVKAIREDRANAPRVAPSQPRPPTIADQANLLYGQPTRVPNGLNTPLSDAQPFDYQPDMPDGDVEDLAGTTNEKYARKMLGYDTSTFREMIHRFKKTNGIGPNDDLEFEENGDVSFNGEYIDNFHDYGN